MRPIAEPSPTGQGKLEAASFNGVTPGVSTVADVEKAWGLPKEIKKQDGLLTHRFSVEPFDRVEVTYSANKVSAVVIRFGKPFPADGVAKQLELTDVRPVLVSNELGEMLGQAYPERGVLFAFEPSNDGKPSMKVLQIILEPIERRAVRAARRNAPRNANEVEPARPRTGVEARAGECPGAVALRPRAGRQRRTGKGGRESGEAVQLEPDNPHYRVTRAQVLGQLGQLVEAMQEAQKAVELAKSRPHVRARALCLLGDLSASGPKPDYRQALNLHTEAINVADELTNDQHPAVRLAAKEVLVDAHLGAAHDIAWGDWKEKEDRVPRWLERAAAAADDLIASEGAGEEQRFRVCTRALAACVGVRGGCDPSVWTRAALHLGQKQIDACHDPIRKAQLQWDLGIALYDALQVFQMRSDHASALKYGEHAIKYLSSGETKPSPAMAYLLGRLYFRLGAVHSLREQNHQAATVWFDKAIPLLEKPLPPEAAADTGRHGETFVSMGVSYWEIGQRETGRRADQQGREAHGTGRQAGRDRRDGAGRALRQPLGHARQAGRPRRREALPNDGHPRADDEVDSRVRADAGMRVRSTKVRKYEVLVESRASRRSVLRTRVLSYFHPRFPSALCPLPSPFLLLPAAALECYHARYRVGGHSHGVSAASFLNGVSMRNGLLKCLAFIVLFAAPAAADEAEEREALAKLLPEFQSAWNKSDVAKLMTLYHNDSRVKKAYDAEASARTKAEQAFKEIQDHFGAIKSHEIRKYIAKKNRFVVRVTYERQGMVPGTFAVKTDKDEKWRISDFNIDGQGEPELKE